MEEGEFSEAREDLASLEADYQDLITVNEEDVAGGDQSSTF